MNTFFARLLKPVLLHGAGRRESRVVCRQEEIKFIYHEGHEEHEGKTKVSKP